MAANEDHVQKQYITDPQVRIGHVHLKVANLERAIGFYSGVLGLSVMQRFGDGFTACAGGEDTLAGRCRSWRERSHLSCRS